MLLKELSIENNSESGPSFGYTLEKLTSMFAKERTTSNGTINMSPLMINNTATNEASNQNENLPPSVTAILTDTTTVDSEVEVSCDDAGFTISVTTGPEINLANNIKSGVNSSTKAENSQDFSFFVQKEKKILKSKREVMEEARRKWLASERRHLMASLRRPNSSLASLKKEKNQASVKVSISCDPPFPSNETMNKNNLSSELEERDKLANNETSLKSCKKGGRIARSSRRRYLEENKTTLSAHLLYTLPPAKEKEKQTRNSLTLAQKIKVIDAFLSGKSQRQIARLYGIGKTQVNGIVRRREEILSLYHDNLDNSDKLTMKRQRKSEYASLNQHLIKWYQHMTSVAGIKITAGMLRAKAMQIAPELGCHDFKGSNGWLATFKANNNLKFSNSSKSTKKSKDYSSSCISSPSNLTKSGVGTCYNNSNNSDDIDEDDNALHDAVDSPSINNESEDQDLFDESEGQTEMNNAALSSNNISVVNENSSNAIATIHHQRETHLAVGNTGTIQGSEVESGGNSNIAAVINHSISNSLLSASGSALPKPQMTNMPLGTNLAYNLTREHTHRSEMQTRSDIHHLGDIHSTAAAAAAAAVAVNHSASSASSLSALQKPDGALSYKSEEYAYDPQGRMNEVPSASRTSEYNYTPYGFPGTYYGYHFLGQY